jgi:protease-4
MVNSFFNQFVHVVATGRHMSEEQVRVLADGRVYTGTNAKCLGLVDDVGYLEDAIATAKRLAKICDAAVVAYDRGSGYRGSIYSGMPTIPSKINIHLDLPGLSNSTGAAFMYLWETGGPH